MAVPLGGDVEHRAFRGPRPRARRRPSGAKAPPGGLIAAWTMRSEPSLRSQLAIALPAASTPISRAARVLTGCGDLFQTAEFPPRRGPLGRLDHSVFAVEVGEDHGCVARRVHDRPGAAGGLGRFLYRPFFVFRFSPSAVRCARRRDPLRFREHAAGRAHRGHHEDGLGHWIGCSRGRVFVPHGRWIFGEARFGSISAPGDNDVPPVPTASSRSWESSWRRRVEVTGAEKEPPGGRVATWIM